MKKRKLKKHIKKRLFLALLFINVFALVMLFVFLSSKRDTVSETNEPPVKKVAAEQTGQETAEEPIAQTITVGMIGDILLHDAMLHYGNYDFAFEGVKGPLSDVDFLIANQESMPGDRAFPLAGYPKFNSPKAILHSLKNVGVDLIALANNHALDLGEAQMIATIDNVKETGLPYVGAYTSYDDQSTLRVFDVEGVSVGVLAYTYGTNVYKQQHPEGKSYLVNILDEERIVTDLKEMKKEVDLVVLSLHWGDEYVMEQNEGQRELAKTFARAGADVIFGHHPHVLQPHETIEGVPVFYSIGNFYSAMPWAGTNIGGIARITATKVTTGETSVTKVEEANFFPTGVIRDVPMNGQANAFRILPLRQIGALEGYDATFVEDLLGVPSWTDASN